MFNNWHIIRAKPINIASYTHKSLNSQKKVMCSINNQDATL
jgi:hypothetical protein